MPLVRDRDNRRLHVKSKLMGESLVSKKFLEGLETSSQVRLFPDVNVLKIGGQSICDRGVKALPDVVREIVANKDCHKMLLTAGGGTRSRHIYAIGLELGMPTGVIAKFGSAVSEQNALLVTMLLSPWGGVKIGHDDVVKLPTYFAQGCIPVMHAMPPDDYFSLPPETGRVPMLRTDVGTLLLADLIGARSCIFIKDEDGLFTDDPKKNPETVHVPEVGARSLLESDQDDLVIERFCLEILQRSEVLERVQIVNGLRSGNFSQALAGEPVGTVIWKEEGKP